MQSRIVFSAIFLAMMLALTLCAVNARRHYKSLGRAVAWLDFSFIPPILGNSIIVISQSRLLSLVGYYIYFIGMDLVVYGLLQFTCAYCSGASKLKKMTMWIKWILIFDAVQILFNPFTGHTFDIRPIIFEDGIYYELLPYLGQAFHRLVDYSTIALVLVVFIVATARASKIYRERYSIILFALLVVVIWETFYIVSKIPIDSSMMGLGALGILIYYFSIHYRPLRLLDRMLSQIVSNESEALFIFTPRGKCIWTNKEGCYLVGVREDNCENAPELLEWLFNTKLRRGNWTEQFVTGGGDYIKYYRLENREVINSKKQYTGYYLKVRDVTKEQLKIKRDMYEATHDKLTGLYTKEFLFRSIEAELKRHTDVVYMLVFVNIKNFKIVNDIFGTDYGDYALKCLADFLRTSLSDKCLYGRIGGDNFGVLVPKSEFMPEVVEERLSQFSIKNDQAEYPLQVQIGVYEKVSDDADVTEMFSRARLSLSKISDDYNIHIAYYDENMRNEIIWNQEISAQLTEAIKNRDIRPYLQPIADRDGNIVGAEALVRWIHKEHGFLAPFKFIPTFEKNGMITEIDKYMWRCACEILAEWEKKGWDLFISVNISPKDFYYMDVPRYIRGLIEEYGVKPERLRVEITETVMMNDADKIIGILNEFRRHGFIVEMDDFGSGYSSLNMLKDMPVDVIKIDMKFLGKSDDKQRADTIVKSVIDLSKELGLTSLTEGVETLNQYDGLSKMGCILFQGYYFSKPLPVNEFEELFEKGKENV